MDKNTLSNYGWIVIAVLVLSVMIALATPFGSYIEQGVRATTEGLFSTSENAMNSAFGAMGVEVEKPTFEEGYKTPSGDTNTEEPSGESQMKPDISQANIIPEGGIYKVGGYVNYDDFPVFVEGTEVFKEGDEFPTPQDGDTYIYGGYMYIYNHYYNLSAGTFMKDTTINGWAAGQYYQLPADDTFLASIAGKNVKLITTQCQVKSEIETLYIPSTITRIDGEAFINTSIKTIYYNGSMQDWNSIEIQEGWNTNCGEITVTCTDGTITIPAWEW